MCGISRFAIFSLLTIFAPAVAGADEEIVSAEMQFFGKYQIFISPTVKGNNSGETVERFLGAAPKVPFCALAETNFYRHGNPNRGGLACEVKYQNGGWLLSARGPTKDKNTSGGAAFASCKAICLRKP